MTLALEIVFWASLAALAWTHLGYPLAVAALARLRPRPPRRAAILPAVTLVVPAHNEEDVIERKLENVLALDYPGDRLEIVVASDDSSDATHDIVARFEPRGVRLIRCERGGKVAAQDRAVRETSGEIVAFGDANVEWDADALRELVAPFADPAVGMACGQVRLVNPVGGTNQEGVYWRYEMWLRARESLVHSMTGSNGAIYAVRREAYREVDPRFGHDLSFPYLMVQNGYRAVYEPQARATENMTTDIEDEFRRKVRMFEHAWLMLFRGRMFRLRVGPVYCGRAGLAPAPAVLERAAARRAPGGERAPGRDGNRLRGRARRAARGPGVSRRLDPRQGPDPHRAFLTAPARDAREAGTIALGGSPSQRGAGGSWGQGGRVVEGVTLELGNGAGGPKGERAGGKKGREGR